MGSAALLLPRGDSRPGRRPCCSSAPWSRLYGQTWGHSFVEFDDPLYVSENGWVRAGLSWANLHWALTNDRAFLWHPLTWISYLVDAELHGVERAGPFLVTNLALHALAAVLLFLALARMTGRAGPSLAVAALFAVHPMQVESVAWVSARKEVLAGAFFMAMLLAYAAYARRESLARYGLVLLLASLCMLAKGTLLLLPLVLLLLDAWPLHRSRPLGRLLLEKLPLLGIAAIDVAVQFRMQAPSIDLAGPDVPLLGRIPIAILAFAGTLRRLLWPVGLSIVYPTPAQMGLDGPGPAAVLASFAALCAITVAVLAARRRAPWLAVGWFWFALLLGPMTGLAPAGLRVMHDRYSYVPMVGLALALVFGAERAVAASPAWRRAVRVALGVALAICAGLTWRQVGVWRDSFTLFDHALAVNDRDAVSWFSRGTAWAKAGDLPRAMSDLERAIAIRPDHADAQVTLGYLELQRGDLDAALAHLRRGVELRPQWSLAHLDLGRALEAAGDPEAALAQLEQATRVGLESPDAHYWLAVALERRRRTAEARLHYQRALELDASHHWSRDALDRLSRGGRRGKAPGP